VTALAAGDQSPQATRCQAVSCAARAVKATARAASCDLLKQHRAVATRYDKLAVRYETTAHISTIDIWLRRLDRHLRNTA
jgi:transposase